MCTLADIPAIEVASECDNLFRVLSSAGLSDNIIGNRFREFIAGYFEEYVQIRVGLSQRLRLSASLVLTDIAGIFVHRIA